MSPRPSNSPPLPIGIYAALLPVYAALHLCGNKPLGGLGFISPPAPQEVEMASAVSTNDPQRAAQSVGLAAS